MNATLGSDKLDSLALACRRCNECRYNFTTGTDPQTGKEAPIFNPRSQQWSDHFVWLASGLRNVGITPTDRATCLRLDFNDEFHNPGFIQDSRQLWMQGGWHPPKADLQQE